MKLSYKNTVIKLITALSLICLWIALLGIQILIVEKSFTLISENYSKNVFDLGDNQSDVSARKFSATFTSKDDYLGIVSINFDQRNKITSGNMLFRIKEVGDREWYYENIYDVRQLNDLSFYPFGFPIIDNSDGKNYEIEVELTETHSKYAELKLSKNSPAITTLHKYPKEPLIESRASFAAFLYKRVLNIIHNNYQLFGSVICLLPFISYLFRLILNRRHFTKALIIIIVATILIDTILIFQFFDMAYVTIAVMWHLLLRKVKNPSKYSYEVGFGLLGLSTVAQIVGSTNIVEKSASWAFMFFVTGLILNIGEIRKKQAS